MRNFRDPHLWVYVISARMEFSGSRAVGFSGGDTCGFCFYRIGVVGFRNFDKA